MVLHHQPSYPGVVLPCRILGMVEIAQREGKSKPEVNNRIIATPNWHHALRELEEARDLPESVRKQIEQFFVSAVAFTGKELTIKGWATSKKTKAFVEKNRT
jgi:inorganic pyrophosphatase